MSTELEVGDPVTFKSYTNPSVKTLRGVVTAIDTNFEWRAGRERTTLVDILGSDGYGYKINGERVKRA